MTHSVQVAGKIISGGNYEFISNLRFRCIISFPIVNDVIHHYYGD